MKVSTNLQIHFVKIWKNNNIPWEMLQRELSLNNLLNMLSLPWWCHKYWWYCSKWRCKALRPVTTTQNQQLWINEKDKHLSIEMYLFHLQLPSSSNEMDSIEQVWICIGNAVFCVSAVFSRFFCSLEGCTRRLTTITNHNNNNNNERHLYSASHNSPEALYTN